MARTTEVTLVASGDLRETANRLGWPAQADPGGPRRGRLRPARGDASVARTRSTPRAATASSRASGWAWTCSRSIDRDAPLVVAEAVWQYSHHVLPGLRRHRGPILTVANWDGTVARPRRHAQHQRVADEDGPAVQHDLGRGPDRSVRRRGHRPVDRDRPHRARHEPRPRPGPRRRCRTRPRPWAAAWPRELADRMAILGVFDEGCMGMYNAIIDDEHLNPMGIHKERLSQSALVAEMRLVGGRARRGPAYDWLLGRGMTLPLRAATGRPS